MTDADAENRANWVREALDRYESCLIGYAHRLTGDPERARDIVQDTFLRLCEADPALVDGHLAAWLYTVCRNRALDIGRKERRMNALSDTVLESQSSSDLPPRAALEQTEAAAHAVRLLQALPANQQEVLRLKFQEGLSYKEIAEITGRSANAVGVLIHNGIRSLREQMAGSAN